MQIAAIRAGRFGGAPTPARRRGSTGGAKAFVERSRRWSLPQSGGTTR
jgi:hypothetical protein